MESPRLNFELFGIHAGERTYGSSELLAVELTLDIGPDAFLS